MKTNIMGKYKWCLLAIIAVVLILGIGLSFCVWDTTSIDKIGDIKGEVANYSTIKYKFIDKNGNQNLDNGDIITDFGEYELIVVDTYADSYLVITICNVEGATFSATGNNDYMVSNIRNFIRSTYTAKYGSLVSNIKPHPQLEGDKFFIMSIEEFTSGHFANINNRKSPYPCAHSGANWHGLRSKCQVPGWGHLVANVENVYGTISPSPGDDYVAGYWPIRLAMMLYK